MLTSAVRLRSAFLAGFLGIGAMCLQAADREWLKIDAGDFLVFTDASEKSAMAAAVRFAAYRKAFEDILLASGDEMPPSVLVIFRHQSTFFDHTPPGANTGRTTLLNYSVEVDGAALNAFSSAGNMTDSLSSTLEFETSWMLRRLGYPSRLWMGQGAGKVLAGTFRKSGRWTVGTMHNRSFKYSWEELFLIHKGSVEYAGAGNYEYHSQIEALMHWVLLKDADSRTRFHALGALLRTENETDALGRLMGTAPSDFRKEIGRHFGKFKVREIPFDETAFHARVKAEPAPRAEVLVWTGELLREAGRTERANSNLEEALALAPELAVVQEAWGRRMAREQRFDEAIAAYQRAISAGSRNFASFFYSGVSHMREAEANVVNSERPAGGGGDAAMRAAGELRKAVLLNRGSGLALTEFARALYYSPGLNADDVALLRDRIKPGDEWVFARIQFAMVVSRSDLHAGVDILNEVLADPTVTISGKSHARGYLAVLERTLKQQEARR